MLNTHAQRITIYEPAVARASYMRKIYIGFTQCKFPQRPSILSLLKINPFRIASSFRQNNIHFLCTTKIARNRTAHLIVSESIMPLCKSYSLQEHSTKLFLFYSIGTRVYLHICQCYVDTFHYIFYWLTVVPATTFTWN